MNPRDAREDAAIALNSALIVIDGCGNHGCLIAEPEGMATNGPCQCYRDKRKVARVFAEVARFRHAYRKAHE